jgi:hypothetical protein
VRMTEHILRPGYDYELGLERVLDGLERLKS